MIDIYFKRKTKLIGFCSKSKETFGVSDKKLYLCLQIINS